MLTIWFELGDFDICVETDVDAVGIATDVTSGCEVAAIGIVDACDMLDNNTLLAMSETYALWSELDNTWTEVELRITEVLENLLDLCNIELGSKTSVLVNILFVSDTLGVRDANPVLAEAVEANSSVLEIGTLVGDSIGKLILGALIRVVIIDGDGVSETEVAVTGVGPELGGTDVRSIIDGITVAILDESKADDELIVEDVI